MTEAGYRCAVPTCRGAAALEFEHIEEWCKVKEHRFEDMIVLCATCHARVTRKEISKGSIRTYKQNLAIISGRYSLYEMRALELFHSHLSQFASDSLPLLQLPRTDYLHVKGLEQDGLVKITQSSGSSVRINGLAVEPWLMQLTPNGKEFITSYFGGKELRS